MIFSGLKLKKNDFFFHNGMIYNFPELGKTKPVNSKTRFVMLKLQNIWSDFSSNIGYLLSKREVMGREGVGNSQSRGLSLWVWLSGSAFRGTYPVPTLYSEHPLSHLAFSPPPPTPHSFSLPLSSYSAGRLGQTLSWLGGKRKGWWKPLQGLSLKPWWWKDSMNLNNFSQENSILCLLKSKALVTLNQVRMKIQDFWLNRGLCLDSKAPSQSYLAIQIILDTKSNIFKKGTLSR